MTSAAGLTYFHFKTNACEIKLSFPLLQYRTKQNLIEILLHEMIHAMLYLQQGRARFPGKVSQRG